MVRRASKNGPSNDGGDGGASTLAPKPGGSQNAAAPFSLSGVQRKLRVGSQQDAAEQEADRVAEQVASGPSSTKPTISRMETMERPSGTASFYFKLHDRAQPSSDNELNHSVRRKAGAPSEPGGDLDEAAMDAVATKGPGAPLRPHVLQTLELRMGVTLGGVRVHEGSGVQRSADAINARAFTHKNDIWLGRGELQEDLRLMAHEATHVVQQAAAPTSTARPGEERPAAAPTVGGVRDEAATPKTPIGEQPVAALTVAAPGTIASAAVAPTMRGAGEAAAVPATSAGETLAAPPAGEGGEKGAAPAKATASGDAADAKTARPAPTSGEDAAGERKKAVERDPRQAIAPTIGAVRHRAQGARAHPAAKAPVDAAEVAGTDPTKAAVRTADEGTVDNFMAATKIEIRRSQTHFQGEAAQYPRQRHQRQHEAAKDQGRG